MVRRFGIFSFISQMVLPARCVGCGIPLDRASSGHSIVFPCGWPRESPAFFNRDFSVKILGRLSISARILCGKCWLKLTPSTKAAFPEPWGGIPAVTPFITNDLLLSVIRFLKFENGRTAVPPLSWWIAASIERYDRSIIGSDASIVPIPLHRARKSQRGYNQAELLAREVASMLHIEVDEGILRRKRNTRPQSKLSAARRRLNVEKAFIAGKDDVRPGRNIILIDDLITTGETVRACVEALQEISLAPVIAAAAGRSR